MFNPFSTGLGLAKGAAKLGAKASMGAAKLGHKATKGVAKKGVQMGRNFAKNSHQLASGQGIDAGPSGGFMSRLKNMAMMPMQMGQNPMAMGRAGMGMPMNRPQAPAQPQMPSPEAGISTGPSSPMTGIMPGAEGMTSGIFNGGGPGGMAGLWNPMAPKLDPNTGQYATPQTPFGNNSIFSRIYGNMGDNMGQVPQRPQIYY